jgi:hypothetical protein
MASFSLSICVMTAPSTPATNGGRKRLGNPLLQFADRGSLDVLDAKDIEILSKHPDVTIEHNQSDGVQYFHSHFKGELSDDIERRCTFSHQWMDLTLRVSKRDLDSFEATEGDLLQQGDKLSACVARFDSKTSVISTSRHGKTLEPGVILTQSLEIMQNDLQNLPAGCGYEVVFAGTDVMKQHAEMMLSVMGEEATHAKMPMSDYFYYKSKQPDKLVFQATSREPDKSKGELTKRKLVLQRTEDPQIDQDPEVQRLAQIAMLPLESLRANVDVHVVKVKTPEGKEELRRYCVVPEIHGMGELIKQYKERLVSHVNVFAELLDSPDCPVFLRLPEKAFEEACELFKHSQFVIAKPTELKDIAVYVACKHSGKQESRQRASTKPQDPDDYDLKHTVIVRIEMLVMRPKLSPDQDRFLARPGSLHRWVPGLNFMDPLLMVDKSALKKTREFKDDEAMVPQINFGHMHEALRKEQQKRMQVKRDKPDETLRQNILYKDRLIEGL